MSKSVFDCAFGFDWKKDWRGRWVTKSVPGYTLKTWQKKPLIEWGNQPYTTFVSVNGKIVEKSMTFSGSVGIKTGAGMELRKHLRDALERFTIDES